jgi:nitrite reductase/ring-hydroxylating ferredoxin subunit
MRLVPVVIRPEPGRIVSLKAGDQTVAVANVDGEFFAFPDSCTHEECPLSEGELDGHVVICDCHGGMFDIRTGEPVGGPVYVALRTFRVIRAGTDLNVAVDEHQSPP